MHFEKAVNDKLYKELEAEYDLLYRLVNAKINIKMIIQVKEVYTMAMFLEIQNQFEQAIDLDMDYVMNGGNIFYLMKIDGASKKRYVKKETDNTLSCSVRCLK